MAQSRSSDPSVGDETETHSVLPRYLDVLQACEDLIVARFGAMFNELFDHVDNFVLAYAETARTNEERNRCFEFMSTILMHQASVERVFAENLTHGFALFREGSPAPLRAKSDPKRADKLSLVEKDDYEVSLAYAGMLHYANTQYAEQLFALNHRLAILNGGVKLGEYNPALPGSPAQVCDAIQNALDSLEIEIDHRLKVAFVRELDQRILRQADQTYADYNDVLIKNEILPNLSLEAIGYDPATHRTGGSQSSETGADEDDYSSQQDSPQPPRRRKEDHTAQAGDESSLDREIFQSIQEVLARRHQGGAGGGGSVAAGPQTPTNLPDLLNSLKLLTLSAPPVAQQQYSHLSLDNVKESFADQLARLSEIIKEQKVNTADADIIDLVGMLFEFILNDNTLPDSVKALLSHLHTPILKVALLDKKFFFRSKHPARRLLNAMTQAGGLCNAEEGDENGMFSKMQSIVDHVLQHFDDDTSLFEPLLEDFNDYMENFNRKSRVVEKRSVDTAKGRERLREARQTVTREIIDRTWNRSVPKSAENLLMGPWANLMVLTVLRSGQDSPEWSQALAVVDDVLWSITPKVTNDERKQLKQRLPEIHKALRDGLNQIGDPEVNSNALLEELAAYHKEMLEMPLEKAVAAIRPEPALAPSSADRPQPKPAPVKPIWNDVEAETPEEREQPFLKNADPVLLGIVDHLRSVKLGTTFEFTDIKKNIRFRAKLSWYSSKTSYYIFVNQAGIQVAVKSLRNLAKELQLGEARIIPQTRKPFMERALQSIHTLLAKPEGERAQGAAVPSSYPSSYD